MSIEMITMRTLRDRLNTLIEEGCGDELLVVENIKTKDEITHHNSRVDVLYELNPKKKELIDLLEEEVKKNGDLNYKLNQLRIENLRLKEVSKND